MSNRAVEVIVKDETRFDGVEADYQQIMGDRLIALTELVTGDAQRGFPASMGRLRGVDTGAFRSSIAPAVYSDRANHMILVGEVFSSSPYAHIIEGVDEQGNETEFGRRPGTAFPNIGALRRWVERVIGVEQVRARYLEEHKLTETKISNDDLLQEATINIGRGIVAKGIKPVRPIGNAFRENLTRINREVDDAIAEIFE